MQKTKPSIVSKAKDNQHLSNWNAIKVLQLQGMLYNPDPLVALKSGRLMASNWAKSLDEENHLQKAQSFIYKVIEVYWTSVHHQSINKKSLPLLPAIVQLAEMDDAVFSLAEAIGRSASKLEIIEASFHIGNIYTTVLPSKTRSSNGVFYTPPSLTKRLLDVVENQGIDWTNVKVVDPACGGGAFLAPVALRMIRGLQTLSPIEVVRHVEDHLSGFEIDPFGAWLSQVFLEVSLKDFIKAAGIRIKFLIKICDSLTQTNFNKYDLVIGNPPYGRTKLSIDLRNKFKRGLYGHANLYGLFTELSVQLTKPYGLIALVTPTSFLSGEYFKNLRLLLREETATMNIDFVSFRKGVFEDVLQETILSIYRKNDRGTEVCVNQISPISEFEVNSEEVGLYKLPKMTSAPWILPRSSMEKNIVSSLLKMKNTLADWGYYVSTGQLVWNRHKKQLVKTNTLNCYPIIWAEAITSHGLFLWKADKKNHSPYFKFLDGDEWLITTKPCVLLQRTTSKEQSKRLIAAALPEEFLAGKRGVVIENHLNMIKSLTDSPKVSLKVLAAFLNSSAVDSAFRCVSGSVAVSAYEIEYLPLPSVDSLAHLTKLVLQDAAKTEIDEECYKLYSLN